MGEGERPPVPGLKPATTRCGGLSLILLLALCTACTRADNGSWPRWQRFVEHFVSPEGRIIDLRFEQKSTSEGQSYALFFALVANDRAQFERILEWTDQALAGGELGQRLPAWHWGIDSSGQWGIKDANAAADGDLWIAYSLFEAARLWQVPAYADTARHLLARIHAEEVADAGLGGLVLLPGPQGFVLGDGRYRVDPSYLPGFQLHYLAHVDPAGPWQRIWRNYLAHTREVFAGGIAPDLYTVDRAGRIGPDPDRALGGYDAIRVYLWAAMSAGDSAELLQRLMPFATLVRESGRPPELVEPLSGEVRAARGPYGFSGALLPYFAVLGDDATLRQQARHVHWARWRERLTRRHNYYDEVLTLFGEGWIEGRYRFDEQGRVWPRWAGAASLTPVSAAAGRPAPAAPGSARRRG